MTELGPFGPGPVIVAIAGPNGAGKTTFYNAHLRRAGYRYLNADVLAREFNLGAYEAARLASQLRQELVRRRESFVFETVFSDPVGDKLQFLREAESCGYTVVVCYIGLTTAAESSDRVAMRVSQGGHDVPEEKLVSRFPRTLANLRSAIRDLSNVLIFDNSDLAKPFRQVGVFRKGEILSSSTDLPEWLTALLDNR